MNFVRTFVTRLLCLGLLAAQLVAPALAAGTEGTIYDSRLLTRIKFTAEQLPAIKKILDQSEERIVEVFQKHRIDPRAKPDFERLRAASVDLQAIESWERTQMKQILTTSQYADYLEIQQATAAAVIKATRND